MKLSLTLLVILLISSPVLNAQSGKLVIARQSISASGGGYSTSQTRALFSTLGEPFAGVSKNSTRILYSGFLFPRPPSGPTGVTRLPQVPSGIKLHQNYPNPVTTASGLTTTIRFEIDRSADVVLMVQNSLGQTVAKVVDQYITMGFYTATLPTASLPAGAYTILMVATSGNQQYIQRQSMILLK